MGEQRLLKFNDFRNLCLRNAADSIKAAEELLTKKVNHIVYHLSLLALEEVGKIFMYWIQINQTQNWDEHNLKITMDDHVKKIFYAIWGPSIGTSLISKSQIEEHQFMASTLHNKRLETLYGDINDTLQSSMKITDEETIAVLNFVRSRYALASIEGEVNTEISVDPNMDWFEEFLKMPGKKNYVFGKDAQEKLIELDDVNAWIIWLKTNHEKEEEELAELAKKELARKPSLNFKTLKPKWLITFTIITPSHSIPPTILSTINKKWNEQIKLFPGKNKHTLIVKNTLYENTHVSELWDQGWLSCKLYVIALNAATALSLFYWHTNKDIDKYYDTIKDLETGRNLEVRISPSLTFNWSDRKAHLTEQNLELAFMVYRHLIGLEDKEDAQAIMDYSAALAMYAKTDVHLRLEKSAFNLFYLSFFRLIHNHHKIDSEANFADVAFYQIEGMLKGRTEFDIAMKIGEELQSNVNLSHSITLREVAAMKNYCDLFILTIAARANHKDKAIRLIPT